MVVNVHGLARSSLRSSVRRQRTMRLIPSRENDCEIIHPRIHAKISHAMAVGSLGNNGFVDVMNDVCRPSYGFLLFLEHLRLPRLRLNSFTTSTMPIRDLSSYPLRSLQSGDPFCTDPSNLRFLVRMGRCLAEEHDHTQLG